MTDTQNVDSLSTMDKRNSLFCYAGIVLACVGIGIFFSSLLGQLQNPVSVNDDRVMLLIGAIVLLVIVLFVATYNMNKRVNLSVFPDNIHAIMAGAIIHSLNSIAGVVAPRVVIMLVGILIVNVLTILASIGNRVEKLSVS